MGTDDSQYVAALCKKIWEAPRKFTYEFEKTILELFHLKSKVSSVEEGKKSSGSL